MGSTDIAYKYLGRFITTFRIDWDPDYFELIREYSSFSNQTIYVRGAN